MSYSLTDDTYDSESDYDSSSADDDARGRRASRRQSESDPETSKKEIPDGEKTRSTSASPAPTSPAPSVVINGDRPSSAKSSHSRRGSKASSKSAKTRRESLPDVDGGDGEKDSASEEEVDEDALPPPEVLLQRAHRRIRRLLRKASRKKAKSDVSALDDFVRCVPLARIIFGDFHWRLARAHADLALAYLDLLQLPAQSLEHATTAKTLLTQNVHLSDDALEKVGILETFLITYYTLGRSSARLDKDTEAEKALAKAEKLHAEFAKLVAADHVVVAEWEIKIVLATARLCAKRKSFVAAEEEFGRCLNLMEAFHESSTALALVPVLLDLAKMKLSIGTASQTEASIELFHRAHDINVEANEKGDEDDLATARSALSLGQAYAALDKDESHASAEAYVRKAAETMRASLGCGDEETQAALCSLAKLLVRMTKTSEAVDVLKSKIRGRFEVEGGEFSEAMAADHHLIANIFLAGGELERAQAHLKKCVDIRKIVLGPNHRKTREALATINSISH